MANPIHSMTAAWHSFRDDEPGQRFFHHYERAQEQRSITKTALRLGVGVALIAGGVVLWFLPGPGWLLVLFGLAMFAAESRPLALYLDRVEVFGRAQSRRLRRWWRPASY